MAPAPDPARPRRDPNAEDPSRLVQLFAELCCLGPEVRGAELERIRRLEPELADDLGGLLAHHDRSGAFLDPDRNDPAVPPGWGAELVPGFRVIEELGVGATGIVYRALQIGTGREVALKVLRWDSRDEPTVRRFEREGALLGSLDHPHLAQVHSVGVLDLRGHPLPWIAMELIDGQRFDAAAAGAHWSTVVERVADAAAALGVAHAAGVVHRDLKPANVLVEGGGRVVVLDFGIARVVEESRSEHQLRTLSGLVLGTLAYMAPEQASGRPEAISPPADVHALGVMLHEALSGELPVDLRPMDTPSALQTIARGVRSRLRVLRPELPIDLDRIVGKALELDPRRRYANGEALEADLRRLLARRPVEARPATLAYRTALLVRRNRLAVTSLGAVFLALVVGLGVALRALAAARDSEARAARTADLLLAQDLERRADRLWPALPERLPDLDAWIAEARGLRERLGDDLLEWPPTGIQPGRPDAEREPRQIAADLFDPNREHGGWEDVLDRRDRARRTVAATIEREAEGWREARARVRLAPAYEGLEFVPQAGLVPLGADPETGLEEFALQGRTGTVPRRDAEGRLPVDHETGIVLVLLPGGRFLTGAQSQDPRSPRHDPLAYDRLEWFGADVVFDLDPFFVAKYELTHHQFVSEAGWNPSFWQPGEFELDERVPISWRGPVESLTQAQARAFCLRLGLDLPTSIQHEYATRAGTETPYWTGPSWESARGKVCHPGLGVERDYLGDDGRERRWKAYDFPAPTGIYEPNPFGLYDMQGNIREWTREVFWVERDPKAIDRRSGDWVEPRDDPYGDHYGVRGWGIGDGLPKRLRSSDRLDALGRSTNSRIGFRPMRRLDGPWTRSARPADDPHRTAAEPSGG